MKKTILITIVLLNSVSPLFASSWWKGQLHTHSLWTYPTSTVRREPPETVMELYQYYGYNFVVFTEHKTIQNNYDKWINVDSSMMSRYEFYLSIFGDAWVDDRVLDGQLQFRLKPMDEYRPLFEDLPWFCVIQGEEISDGDTNHVGAINNTTDISISTSVLNKINGIMNDGKNNHKPVLGIVNHPAGETCIVTAAELENTAIRFFEIYNRYEQLERWDEVLAARLDADSNAGLLYGVATDDVSEFYNEDHNDTIDEPVNRGYVMVRNITNTEDISSEAVIEAMYRGDFYASTGVELDELSVNQAGIYIDIASEGGVTYTTKYIGVLVPGGYAQVLQTSTGTKSEYLFTGNELYVRAKITSTKPMPHLKLQETEYERAWIQPVRVVSGTGLQGYWKLNETVNPSKNTTAADSSGKGYNGVYKGSSSGTGPVVGNNAFKPVYGKSVRFNGGYDCIEITNSDFIYSNINDFTVAAWVKPDSYGSVSQTIIGNEGRWRFRIQNSNLIFESIARKTYTVSLSDVNAGNWMHVAAVITRNNDCIFYVNGQCKGTILGTSGSVDNPDISNFCIGRCTSRSWSNDGYPFIGLIDEVRYYDRALRANEVLELTKTPIVLNGNFESGSSGGTADYWYEGSPDASYFYSSAGPYNNAPYIEGRAAMLKSNGTAYIQQTLPDVLANSFDIYRVCYYNGCRSDEDGTYAVDPMRVSLWDVNTNTELLGQSYSIPAPGLDNSQTPNVGSDVYGSPVYKCLSFIPNGAGSNHQIALRFTDLCNVGGTGYKATAVIDNVSIDAFSRTHNWKFENNYTDSVTGLNGTPYGSPTFTTDHKEGTKAISLNSANHDRVSLGTLDHPENFTITAWAKVTGASGTYRTVLVRRSNYVGYTIYANSSNKWSFWTGNGTSYDKLDGPSVTLNQWVFIAVTFEKTAVTGTKLIGTKSLYINGQLYDVAYGNIYAPAELNYITYVSSSTNSFQGKIDDIRIYDRILNDGEIYQIYETYKPVCTTPYDGDINSDCVVDFQDFAEMAADWLACGWDIAEACQ